MNKFKKIISSPHFSTGALMLAAILLVFSTVGGARAALTDTSDYFSGEVDLGHIGVSLVETNAGNPDGKVVSKRDYIGDDTGNKDGVKWDETTGDLLEGLLTDAEGNEQELVLGQAYKEELSVRNSGGINEFVRVSVYKYWLDENGEKDRSLDPKMIKLTFDTSGDWVIDSKSTTDERTVLYYEKRLAPGDETTPFTKTLAADGAIKDWVTRVDKTEEVIDGVKYTTFTTVYTFDGKEFCVEAIVDAVQDHHADKAIKSAWGVNATWNGGDTVKYSF